MAVAGAESKAEADAEEVTAAKLGGYLAAPPGVVRQDSGGRPHRVAAVRVVGGARTREGSRGRALPGRASSAPDSPSLLSVLRDLVSRSPLTVFAVPSHFRVCVRSLRYLVPVCLAAN